MNDTARLRELVHAYNRARDTAAPVTPEELCRDCPDLLQPLRREIEAQSDTYQHLNVVDTQASPQPHTPPDWLPPRDVHAIRSGDKLDKYEIRRTIGDGGMGEVFAAYDPDLDREEAIKVMRPAMAARPDARAYFLREARSAAKVKHDNIVPIHYVGEANGVPYLVMPLLAGESLKSRLERGPLPPDEVMKLARETLSGLAAAHERDLIHRDIKPGNLWLENVTGGWRVKILDFGLARPADPAVPQTVPGAVVGTPHYMSPEQAHGQPLDPRSDLFSLAAVLYEAATGVRAFQGTTTTAALVAVASHEPLAAREVNPQVPRALSEWIQRLLAKGATRRPESARAALTELIAATNDETVSFPNPPPVPTPTRRPRWPWAMAATILFGLLAVLAAVPMMRDRKRGNDVSSLKPAASDGSVDLHVLTNDLKLLSLMDSLSLPLKLGDRFRIEASVDKPAYIYLFWIDANGRADPMYPWDDWDKVGTAMDEKPVTRISLPENPGQGLKFKPAATGLDTLLMLARQEPLKASADEMRLWFADLTPLHPLPAGWDNYRAWFDDFHLRKGDNLRAPKFEQEDLGLPSFRLQGELQARLRDRAPLVRAVSFATRSTKGD